MAAPLVFRLSRMPRLRLVVARCLLLGCYLVLRRMRLTVVLRFLLCVVVITFVGAGMVVESDYVITLWNCGADRLWMSWVLAILPT